MSQLSFPLASLSFETVGRMSLATQAVETKGEGR